MSDKFTTARLSKGQDRFEILVKPQPALDYKLGKPIPLSEVLMIEEVYSDSGKGTRASEEKLQKHLAFRYHRPGQGSGRNHEVW